SVRDVALQVGGDAFQPTDGDGAAVDPVTSTRRLARSVTRTTEDSGKDVRLAVQHVRVVELTLGDQANVTGNVGVGGTGPLAIDDLVVVVRILIIRRFHAAFSSTDLGQTRQLKIQKEHDVIKIYSATI